MGVNSNDTVQIRARNTEGVSPKTEFNLTGKKSLFLPASCVYHILLTYLLDDTDPGTTKQFFQSFTRHLIVGVVYELIL